MADMQQLTISTDDLIAEKQGATGWLTFNRPERMNAVSYDMWCAVPSIMAHFAQDDDIRIIAMKGAGDKAFVAGADISQFGENRGSAEAAQEYEQKNVEAFDAIAACEKPTLAMINGYCIGGGLGIALSCDIRIASLGSTFAIPAAKLGLGYPAEGIKHIVSLIGPQFAKELFYTARQFSHDDALKMGLINQLTTKEDLREKTDSLCAMISANAPLTLKASKKAIDAVAAAPETYDLKVLEGLVSDCFESEDYIEGRRAFEEKRKPIFKGK